MNRELWFVAPGRVEVREGQAVREVGPSEVRVRALASGISQGTEMLLYRGDGPTPFDPSLDGPDTPTYPRRYGYAWVGEVEEAGDRAGIIAGTRVFALAPHGDVHVLDATAVRSLQTDAPHARCVLAANLETALTAIWDSGIGLGDRVVVIGCGIVGLLCTWLARRAGAQTVHVVEPSRWRREAAVALGATSALPPTEDTRPNEADVVIEASGDPACLDSAIAHAGREAVVTIVSFYGARAGTVHLGDAFHRLRLRLVSSQVSAVPPLRTPRWSLARRFGMVARLLDEPALDLLIEPPVPFDEAETAYAKLAAEPGESLQVCFRYTAAARVEPAP